ncbi:hypothetical protein EYF80_018438 [Liparis tanakae]|uniref:Uncharacterized protein n=1 Tax=Liparis tanakae TaxID=230148 RepID=A0A4Z2I0N8_9TELE|nr:hypothetical protein EYF80_018438 [Liparis tanakae]
MTSLSSAFISSKSLAAASTGTGLLQLPDALSCVLLLASRLDEQRPQLLDFMFDLFFLSSGRNTTWTVFPFLLWQGFKLILRGVEGGVGSHAVWTAAVLQLLDHAEEPAKRQEKNGKGQRGGGGGGIQCSLKLTPPSMYKRSPPGGSVDFETRAAHLCHPEVSRQIGSSLNQDFNHRTGVGLASQHQGRPVMERIWITNATSLAIVQNGALKC